MQLVPSTQEELLRQHQKDISRLKSRPNPLPVVGYPMAPSQVNGTTGIAIGTVGQVVFANAQSTSFDIRDIFTTDWDDYLLYLDIYTSSVAMKFLMQLRNSAGTYTAADYRWGAETKLYGGASAWTSALGSSNVQNAMGGSSGTGGGSLEATIFSPARTGTEVKMASRYADSAGLVIGTAWCGAGVGIANGIRLSPSPSTAVFSGVLRCYGINHL